MKEQDEERIVCGLRIRIDRLLCVGFEDCVAVAPDVFRMDDDGIATFVDDAEAMTDRARLIEACRVCPVDALNAIEPGGHIVAP